MASANVELVRSILAAWERGTPSPAEWAHPEIEYVIVGGPSPGTWTGLAGMAEGFRDWLGAWKDLRFDVDHYRELVRYFGDDDPATRVMLEEILVIEEEHANDMHDLLVAHEGRPMLSK